MPFRLGKIYESKMCIFQGTNRDDLEYAKTARGGCNVSSCKKADAKILKGKLKVRGYFILKQMLWSTSRPYIRMFEN